MSTVVVARKGGTLAIASDSLVTFGETRLPPGYEANTKMFAVGGSWVGAVGTTAHQPVLRQALAGMPGRFSEPGAMRRVATLFVPTLIFGVAIAPLGAYLPMMLYLLWMARRGARAGWPVALLVAIGMPAVM
jgi:hypothetical protein